MSGTIQERVYALVPIHPYGISLRELRRAIVIYPDSVNNAVTRLRQMGLIEPVPHNPGRYRRIEDVPCPCDRRGWTTGKRHRRIEKAAIA